MKSDRMSSWGVDQHQFATRPIQFSASRRHGMRLPRIKLTKTLNRDYPVHPEFTYYRPPSNIRNFRYYDNYRSKNKAGDIPVTIQVDYNSPSAYNNHDRNDYSIFSYFRDMKKYANYGDVFSEKEEGLSFKSKVLMGLFTTLYLTYFIAVLAIHSRLQYEDYWCSSDGFLIIVTGILLTGWIVFQILMPLFGEKLSYHILKPIDHLWKELLNKGLTRPIFYLLFLSCLVAFLVVDTAEDRQRLVSVLGVISILVFGFLFSKAPRKIKWRQVCWGIGLQYITGYLMLRWPLGRNMTHCIFKKLSSMLQLVDVGSEYIFDTIWTEMKLMALMVMSTIVFFSFLTHFLYHYGVLQWTIKTLGHLFDLTVGTTACEGVSLAFSPFLGIAECFLLIKPYIPKMTRSELHAIMTGAMASLGIPHFLVFESMGVDSYHLINASLMNSLAAFSYTKLFYPETEETQTAAKHIRTNTTKR